MRNPLTTRTAKSATTKRSLTLLGVLALLGLLAGYALAARVATPSITSGPSGSTRATSASFAFRGERDVTFECALDGASYRACASPTAYGGLGEGAHRFQVRGRNRGGDVSSPATRDWRVDLSAPSIALSHPQDGEALNADGWNDGCSSAGRLCGTASDPSGVGAVTLSIRQVSTGRWWNGRAFSATSEQFLAASGSTSWRYALPLPAADGAYAVRVRATDGIGNATAPGGERTATFTIDRQPPPVPQLVSTPPRLTSSKTGAFLISDAEPVAGYQCRLVGYGDWYVCPVDMTFYDLPEGPYTLQVRARDAAGNWSALVAYSWTVDTTAPPQPRIVQKPASASTTADATFTFTDGERGVSFECSLDRAAYAACTSPTSYRGLADGRHRFSVRAVDPAGNRSAAADYDWTIRSSSTTVGSPFTVSGGYAGLLSPGVSGPLAVTISNPNGEAILIESLTVRIEPGSSKPGCDGPANLTVTPSNVSAANPLSVPARGSVTLPSGAVSAPQVLMRNLPTNQDACKGATFTFTYGGSAHS